jgi:hypothetical protein
VDPVCGSAFGMFVLALFQPLFPASAGQSFAVLAWGWSLRTHRHTLRHDLWRTGATTLKHFSRFSVVGGAPLYNVRRQVWARSIPQAAPQVRPDEPRVLESDDFTKKKAGRHLAGRARSRKAAGAARQESRPLRGLHVVLGILRLPLAPGPPPRGTRPIGLALSLKAPRARAQATLALPQRRGQGPR